MTASLQRFLLLALAALMMVSACRAPASVGGASFGLERPNSGLGSMALGLVIPKEAFERNRAHRRVQHVSIERARSVEVSVTASPSGTAVASSAYDVTLTDDPLTGDKIATVVVDNLPAGFNHTVQVAVYDGPLAAGSPTGARLETLAGIIDVEPGQTTSAQISWWTTPTADAVRVLRERGEPQRLLAKSLSGVYATGDPYSDASGTYAVGEASCPVQPGDPKPGANIQLLMDRIIAGLIATRDRPDFHPSLVYGDPLGHLIASYTASQPGYEAFSAGYAVPLPSHPGVNGNLEAYAFKTPARSLDVKVFDMRGQAATEGVELWVEEPSSKLEASPPFDLAYITPGIWWVTGRQTSGALTRTSTFQRQFRPGGSGDLPTVCLTGTTATVASSGLSDPRQICFDRNNNLYVADRGAHRVLKFAPDGTASVVAGSGKPTTSATDPYDLGDYTLDASDAVLISGDPASATLRAPEGVAIEEWQDASGTWYERIFIADTGNHRIRVVDIDGRIKTAVGVGVAGGGVDIRNNADQTSFVPDGKPDERDPAGAYPGVSPGEADGSGLSFALQRPTTLAIGGSNRRTLFVHDSGNRQIRYFELQDGALASKLVPALSVVTLTKAVGVTELHNALAVQSFKQPDGTLKDFLYYCSGATPVQIHRSLIGPFSETILMGGGNTVLPQLEYKLASQIQLQQVRALVVDPLGNAYIADHFPGNPSQGRIYYINPTRFLDVWGLVGRADVPGVYGAYEGSSGPLSPISYPYGLAVRKVDPLYDSPLFIATGGADPRLLKLKPW